MVSFFVGLATEFASLKSAFVHFVDVARQSPIFNECGAALGAFELFLQSGMRQLFVFRQRALVLKRVPTAGQCADRRPRSRWLVQAMGISLVSVSIARACVGQLAHRAFVFIIGIFCSRVRHRRRLQCSTKTFEFEYD